MANSELFPKLSQENCCPEMNEAIHVEPYNILHNNYTEVRTRKCNYRRILLTLFVFLIVQLLIEISSARMRHMPYMETPHATMITL